MQNNSFNLTDNYNLVFKRRNEINIKKVILPYEMWIKRKISLKDKMVLDFGSNIKSPFYTRATSQGVQSYKGFDIDAETINWLKNNLLYIDFWNTTEKFDVINASQVYEHLTVNERIEFCKHAHNLLNDDGLLLLDFPFIGNLNGLRFWVDLTHKPVSFTDDPLLIKNQGFKYIETYLVGAPPFKFFLFLFNFLIFGNWHQTQQVFAWKKDKVAIVFDGVSENWTETLPNDENILPFSMMKDIKNKKVLEAGCGEGIMCRFLNKNGNEVYGVDISSKLLEKANNYKDFNVNYKLGDIRELPYNDNFFDVVYSGGVIEHFEGTEKAIQEMFRVTKPGGTLYIGVPNKISFLYPFTQFLQKINKYNLGYEKAYTYKWLLNECKKHGATSCERISVLSVQNINAYTLPKKIVLLIVKSLDYIPYKLGFGGFFHYIKCVKEN